MPRRLAPMSLFAILVAATIAGAIETAENAADSQIRQSIAALEKAFNSGDAKAMAECWTDDGEFVGPQGGCLTGRKMIESAFGDFLGKHQGATLQLEVTLCRLLTEDVALVDLTAEMTPVPEGVDAVPVSSMVLIKRDGRWLIGSMRETVSNKPAHHLQLRDVEWLVGNWVEDGGEEPGAALRSACEWTANGSYLIRKFTTEADGAVALAGTEVIGWDPQAHRIRSWSFNSNGSFGESIWTQDGNSWIVKYNGVLTDGSDVSAVNVIKLVDADNATLESTDRTINGEKQPGLSVTKFKRCAAKDGPKDGADETVQPPKNVLPQHPNAK